MNAISHTCPLCGNAVSRVGLSVDLQSNNVLVDGRAVKLQARQAEILSILSNGYPSAVRAGQILAKIYGDSGDEPPTAWKAVQVQCCNLKKILHPLGYTIVNEHNRYRLARTV